MPVTSGLPHFQNSQAATNNWEPIFLNQFEVIITPPASVSGADILVEQVKKISGLPEITPVGFVEQFYKFAKRTYAAAKPEDTTAELEMDFEVNLDDGNAMYVYNTFRQWSNIHFNPMTGGQGIKKDYAGEMTVIVFNKRQEVFREFRFKPVFMIEPLKDMEMEYTSEDIYILTCKFKADAWKESRTGQGVDIL